MNTDGLPPLREVIARHSLAAKRSLGQNFLLDLNLTGRIARAAGPLEGVTVIEVGPGPGGLTRALLAEGKAKCPACTVQVQETPNEQFVNGQIPSAIVNAARANPEINFMFFCGAAYSGGIMPALQAAGLSSMKVGGSGMNASAMAQLQASAQVAWIASSFIS